MSWDELDSRKVYSQFLNETHQRGGLMDKYTLGLNAGNEGLESQVEVNAR